MKKTKEKEKILRRKEEVNYEENLRKYKKQPKMNEDALNMTRMIQHYES